MKILLLGAFDKGALENYYLKGLSRSIEVIDRFDITAEYYSKLNASLVNRVVNKVSPSTFFAPINTRLLRFVENRMYDVILIFKGMTLLKETIMELKQRTRLICCYSPDHPFKFFSEGSGNQNILDSIWLYDIYFSYARRIADELSKLYRVNAYAVPFGYDGDSIQYNSSSGSEFLDKWIFIGAYDEERSSFIKKLNQENIDIYGDSKWKSRNRHNFIGTKYFKGRPLYDNDYKQAICSSNGILNLLRRQNLEEQSHNMRTFEAPGYGGLLIANRTDEQMSFFEDGKEAIFFDTIDELNDRMHYLNRKIEKITQIKKAALERSVRSNYSYEKRSDEVYNIIRSHLKR